jgi:hypothetical protein
MQRKNRADIARMRVKRWQRSNPTKDLSQAPTPIERMTREQRVQR